AQLEKQHASLMAEYETLHSIVHPKKSSTEDKSKQETASTTDSSSNKAEPSNSSVAALSKLPALHQQIRLTQAGETHASVLDRWLAFWLDSRVIDITSAEDKAQAGEWYQLLSGLTGPDADLPANKAADKTKSKASHNKAKPSAD